MNIELEIEKLRKEFDTKIEALRANVPTAYEVGKWYKTCDFLFNYQLDFGSYGIHCKMGWVNGWNVEGKSANWNPIPATDSEVEKALIAEAEKRGFKIGVSINNDNICPGISNSKNYKLDRNYCPSIYCSDRDELIFIGNAAIYKQGKWAEIVKDEVRIAGQKVRYDTENCLKIGDYFYSKADVQSCARILSLPKVSGIEVTKCNGDKVIVTKDEIQKIINQWK